MCQYPLNYEGACSVDSVDLAHPVRTTYIKSVAPFPDQSLSFNFSIQTLEALATMRKRYLSFTALH